MTEEERKKLIAKRKKQQKEQELLQSLHQHTDLEERKRAIKEKREQNENPWVRKSVIFFGSLLVLYLFYFLTSYIARFMFGGGLALLGVDLSSFSIVIHAVIWSVAIYSAVTEEPVIDRFLSRFGK